MSRSKSILDQYLEKAWLFDLMLAPILFIALTSFSFFDPTIADKNIQVEAISDLMSSDFTFAGFLLAALTIIVTFRANLKTKNLEKSKDALQLIISTDHYFGIVSVFKQGLLELLIIAFTLMSLKALNEDFETSTINAIFATSFIISVIVVFRTVGLLFKIVGMERHSKETEK